MAWKYIFLNFFDCSSEKFDPSFHKIFSEKSLKKFIYDHVQNKLETKISNSKHCPVIKPNRQPGFTNVLKDFINKLQFNVLIVSCGWKLLCLCLKFVGWFGFQATNTQPPSQLSIAPPSSSLTIHYLRLCQRKQI